MTYVNCDSDDAVKRTTRGECGPILWESRAQDAARAGGDSGLPARAVRAAHHFRRADLPVAGRALARAGPPDAAPRRGQVWVFGGAIRHGPADEGKARGSPTDVQVGDATGVPSLLPNLAPRSLASALARSLPSSLPHSVPPSLPPLPPSLPPHNNLSGQVLSGTFAPRLYKSYNQCPCARPAHVRSRPRLETVGCLGSSLKLKFCQREMATDEIREREIMESKAI